MIAFSRWESKPIDLAANQQLTVLLQIQKVPTRLAALEVVGERVCPTDEGMNLGMVWEEARKALAAASWSDTALGLQHTMQRYYRVDYDANVRGGPRDSERVEVHRGGGSQPFIAEQPHLLRAYGYVWEREGTDVYHGPDADVLLHWTFAATHCFAIVEGEDEHEGMSGIEFHPTEDRTLPDIQGTLWVNTETAELDMIEFAYVNLPFLDRRNRLGGEAYFSRLASGAWIVSRWEIRFPILREVMDAGGRGIRRIEVVWGINQVGGETVQVKNVNGGIEYWADQLANVGGVVTFEGDPAPFIPLVVAGSGYTTRTNADGSFEFRTLLDDKYRINTVLLDSLFYEDGLKEVRFRRGRFEAVELEIPTPAKVMREMCRSGSSVERAIVGAMLAGSNRSPVKDEKVRARWTIAGGPDNPAQTGTVETDTDDLGRYVLCRIPFDADVVLTHRSERYIVSDVHLEFDETNAFVTLDGVETKRAMPYPLVRVDLVVQYGPGTR